MNDCPFCAIAAGTIAADRIYEDEEVVAFRDINPQAPTHILVIPREHIASAAELTRAQDPLWGRVLHVAQQLAVSEDIDASGFRLVTNVGADAGQTVPHLHLHLLGGRAMSWPPG
ncbi:MAG: histidine triad nucleotide-binding protein [Candidatus Dormibacteraeota bacterium]|uniref:Histidine triad nucleotide-binding protein n=1 Tax=Candidatus Amunia macphersoniae TaxID=3127014 RepID=A0A934NAY1_9BACT|nr:histidine triad nucleotide-binding protein [Candidatus Dormibacteraeota bacterium]